MEKNKNFTRDRKSYIRVPVIIDDKSCKKYEKILEQIKESDKIKDIEYPTNPATYTKDDENYVKIVIYFKDNRKQSKFLTFDDYFKLVSADVWDNPEFIDSESIPTATKMEDSDPYNVFFNTLKYFPETGNQLNSIRFTDLLCPSLGKLKCCLHLTFRAQIEWILSSYALKKLHKVPMTIIHGFEGFPWPKDETMRTLYPYISYHFVKEQEKYKVTHHTNMSFFVYDDDSIRIVIGSVNLYADNWDLYNQLLWISPRCPKLPENSSFTEGESPTEFKSALLGYLQGYEALDISSLSTWIERVKSANFQEIKVALLYSMPGLHWPRRNGCPLHFLGHLLSRDCTIPAPKEEHNSWRIIAHTASLGLVGYREEEWLSTTFLKCLASHVDSRYLPTMRCVTKVDFSLIYPTMQDCLDGYLGLKTAGCCRYEEDLKDLQHWLLKYKCKWRANGTKRTRAMSHSKCYCRVSPCSKKMVYFFLTSSNLSRVGWGKIPNANSSIFVRSREIGVLFLPKHFGEEYFEIKDCPDRKNRRLFPIMFDLPLTPYGPRDKPYCGQELRVTLKMDGADSDSDHSDGASAKPLKDTTMAFEKLGIDKQDDRARAMKIAFEKLEQRKLKSRTLAQQEQLKYTGKAVNLFFPSFEKN